MTVMLEPNDRRLDRVDRRALRVHARITLGKYSKRVALDRQVLLRECRRRRVLGVNFRGGVIFDSHVRFGAQELRERPLTRAICNKTTNFIDGGEGHTRPYERFQFGDSQANMNISPWRGDTTRQRQARSAPV